jgi:hypothetical protein
VPSPPLLDLSAIVKAFDAFYSRSYYGASPAELLALGASLGAWVELAFSESLPGDTTVLLRRPA